MNRVFILVVLLLMPFLYAEHSDMAPGIEKQVVDVNPEDSPFDLASPKSMPHSTGRGLGDILLTIDALALGIDGPSGVSWDGQYLYVASLMLDSVFVVDPFIPAIVNRWPSDQLASSPFGCGIEQNLWVTHINPDTAREYTLAGVITGNAFGTEPAGCTWCGDGTEWWQNGEMWLVGVGSGCGNQCIKFSLPDGAVLGMMGHPAWTGSPQRGMSYDPYNEKFWVGGWISDSVWELNLDGSPTGRTFYMDGCAGIAYDWQSTYHPTPVLWITRQAADQIVMVDADNPNPVTFTYFWDFEDGEQGWTHTNGGTFPAAWDVVSSSYTVGSYTIAPPDAGDSSFCIDGDLGGICHDTAMSPVVDNPGFSYFKWGMHFQQYVSYQTFTVIMRTFSSGVWNAWTDVWTYTADTPPRYDSVDISGTVADSVQVGFVYDQPNATYAWFAAFDNVELVIPPEHDVACMAVVSPPEGAVPVATYDVTGNIRNLGSTDETFDVVGHVYDTTGMVLVFDQTVNLTLTAGADTDLVLGQVAFNADSYYYTEIFTTLVGDVDPSNDTSSIYSRTAISLGDVIYELDVQTITGNNRLLGVEFDGTNFYVTGGMSSSGNDSIWVIDTFGTVVCRVGQPTNSIWGLRDLAWDGVYAGPDRIDTLYASDESGLYKFGINLTGSLDNYGTITGPVLPCRALAWDPDDEWFFTANWDPYYKFSKTSPFIDSVSGPGSSYGAAYDTDADSGGWVWWHSQLQVDPGYLLRIDQMDAVTMSWSGLFFGYIPPSLPPSATSNMAGGLCFHEGFRGMDVLFTLVQGDPVDEIVGLYIRDHVTAINEQPDEAGLLVFGFAPGMSTVHRNHVPICYSTTAPSHVSLKVYDNTGRLVRTLVDTQQPAGEKSVLWDNKDLNKRVVANGVYFLKLEAQGETAVQKLVFLK
jgi:hypothetical protein